MVSAWWNDWLRSKWMKSSIPRCFGNMTKFSYWRRIARDSSTEVIESYKPSRPRQISFASEHAPDYFHSMVFHRPFPWQSSLILFSNFLSLSLTIESSVPGIQLVSKLLKLFILFYSQKSFLSRFKIDKRNLYIYRFEKWSTFKQFFYKRKRKLQGEFHNLLNIDCLKIEVLYNRKTSKLKRFEN